MQTFLPVADVRETAALLDSKRLGKQRVEAIQTLRALAGFHTSWVTHPVIRMWRGFERFLVAEYLPAMMHEWERRGYANVLCLRHRDELTEIFSGPLVMPGWLGGPIHISHQSNLVRKNPEYYGRFWNVDPTMPYFWPVPKSP